MKYATHEVREKAHKVAEAALQDIREMLPPEQIEDGYDLEEDGDGGLWIKCGHDVVLHVDADGEEDGRVPEPPSPLSEYLGGEWQ